MPKFPRHETKHSAIAASTGGVISGSTIVRSTVTGDAPPERPASISSRGSARSAARSMRYDSGAYWTPSTRMIPAAEYSGLRAPSSGAAPASFSSGLDGLNSCSHASATTWGANSSGITKQNTNASRPRMSVSDTITATPPPMTTARNVPPNAVTRLCAVAIHVVGFVSVRRNGSREIVPSGATPSIARRAIGSTDSTATTTISHPSSVASSNGFWAAVVRRGLVEGSRRGDHPPLHQALIAEQVGEALEVRAVVGDDAADVRGHQLDRRACRIPRRHAGAGSRRYVAHRRCELLAVVGEDEIDERARGRGVLRRLQDGDGLGHGGQSFRGKHEVDRRALGLRVERHEVDDDAVRLLAVGHCVQHGAVAADGD